LKHPTKALHVSSSNVFSFEQGSPKARAISSTLPGSHSWLSKDVEGAGEAPSQPHSKLGGRVRHARGSGRLRNQQDHDGGGGGAVLLPRRPALLAPLMPVPPLAALELLLFLLLLLRRRRDHSHGILAARYAEDAAWPAHGTKESGRTRVRPPTQKSIVNHTRAQAPACRRERPRRRLRVAARSYRAGPPAATIPPPAPFSSRRKRAHVLDKRGGRASRVFI
jgi:hypothetical protein